MYETTGVYVIAEAGVNHNGSLEMALQLIDVAADAGADAVKFQTFKAENMVTRTAGKARYQAETTNHKESQYEMLKKLELDDEAHEILIEHCQKQGLRFLATPFDTQSVDVLAGKFDLPRLKISSGDITNAPLLLKLARTGKPVILSTGMSTLGEVETALGVLAFGYSNKSEKLSLTAFKNAYCSEAGQKVLKEKVTLLHCTTEYPAPFAEVDLRSMDTLSAAFGLPVGLSDHTTGIAVSIAAVARGAVVIEKHFTLDCNLPGPDHRASLEPMELKAMIQSIKQVAMALGKGLKVPGPTESLNIPIARKSLVALQVIRKGDIFTEQNLGVKRPGSGISPIYYWDLLDKPADRDYKQDEVVIQ
ncbi:MAG: N-acetylneuraminate synthase [Desulfitobacterium hafniense]|nr:N-acetylneuraminate synthase [Desulfitobacterium hafniense]